MSRDIVINTIGIMDPLGRKPNPLIDRPFTNLYRRLAVCDINEETGQLKGCGVGQHGWTKYATWRDAATILLKLRNFQIMLFVAGTGVGKTVIIPKLMMHHFEYKHKIVLTAPRKKIIETAAIYNAMLLDVPIYVPTPQGGVQRDETGAMIPTGELIVGFSHGDLKKYDDTTKLLFATEATIKNIILRSDPLLSSYNGIIIDEAHERGIEIDSLLSLVCGIARKRPEFRIVIMSATVNEAIFIDFFKNKQNFGDNFTTHIMTAPTQFKIEEQYSIRPVPKQSVKVAVEAKIVEILKNPASIPGDILVFFASIPACKQLRESINNKYDTFPTGRKPIGVELHGKIAEEEQDLALKKDGLQRCEVRDGRKYDLKVIFATSTAESSLTFESTLSYVIDTGIKGQPLYNPKIDAYTYDSLYISNAAITQRCGRTGRKNAGFCMHIYSEYYRNNIFPKFDMPKIRQEDITRNFLEFMSVPENEYRLTFTLQFFKDMIEPIENMIGHLKRSIINLTNTGMIIAVDINGGMDKIVSPLGIFAMKFDSMLTGCIDDVRLIAVAHHFAGDNEAIRTFYLECVFMWIAYMKNNMSPMAKSPFANFFVIPKTAAVIAEQKTNTNYIPREYLQKLDDAGLLHSSGELMSLVKIMKYFNLSMLTVAGFDGDAFCTKYNISPKAIGDLNRQVADIKEGYSKKYMKEIITDLKIFEFITPSTLALENGAGNQIGGGEDYKKQKPYAGGKGAGGKGAAKQEYPYKKKSRPPQTNTPATLDETPYLTKLLVVPEPDAPNFVIGKNIAKIVSKLTNGFTQPLRVKQSPDLWRNLQFILFYGYINKIAIRKNKLSDDDMKYSTYFMQNSNLSVGIPNNILSTYYNRYPHYVVYNCCTSSMLGFDMYKDFTQFPVCNEISKDIMNSYTEYPIYDAAVMLASAGGGTKK